jgi:hypothetical protein
MKKVTKAMVTLNKQIKLPELNKVSQPGAARGDAARGSSRRARARASRRRCKSS